LIEREPALFDEHADQSGEDALGHGPTEQRCGGRKAGGIALGHDATVIDHDDGAHAGPGEGIVGEHAIEARRGKKRTKPALAHRDCLPRRPAPPSGYVIFIAHMLCS